MRALALLALTLGSCAAVRGSSDAAHVIWLDHPAEHFTSALPLGNGTMGALVFGGIARERIVLNEIGLWSGSVQDADRADAHEYLPDREAAQEYGADQHHVGGGEREGRQKPYVIHAGL